MRCVGLMAGVMLGTSSVAFAAPAVVQPGPEAAADTFVYQFLPGFTFDGAGWNHLLGTGATTSGHDLEALIRFDVTGLTLDANERATINLYVVDTAAAGFGQSPTPAAPVTTLLMPAQSVWTASTVTWATKPSAGPVAASVVVSGINQWVSFDVTDLVSGWIANPSSNLGVVLRQEAVVINNGPVMGVFSASASADRPFLEIAPIPEPAVLSLLGLGGLALLRRRGARS